MRGVVFVCRGNACNGGLATFESDAPCVPVRLFRLEIETEELYWHGALRVF